MENSKPSKQVEKFLESLNSTHVVSVEERDRPLDWYRNEIQERIAKGRSNPYLHNQLSLILRQVQDEFGTQCADELVDEFHLEKRFSIQKQLSIQPLEWSKQ